MATNLKKSKKIRAFCYRMFAMGAFVTMIASAIIGHDALRAFWEEGVNILTGKVYYLPAFREYIQEVYNNAMLGYAGVGDDKGYPLTTADAEKKSAKAKSTFASQMRTTCGDILYCIQTDEKTDSNFNFPVFSEYDGHLILPGDVDLCYYWNGPDRTLTFLIPSNSSLWKSPQTDNAVESYSYVTSTYQPNTEGSRHIRLVLAVKDSSEYTSGVLTAYLYTAKSYRALLLTMFISGICTVFFLFLSLFSVRAAREAKSAYAALVLKIPVEIKLVIIGITAYLFYACRSLFSGVQQTDSIYNFSGILLFFLAGCLLYLLSTDLKQNGAGIFHPSVTVKLHTCFTEYVDSLPWYRKAMNICIGLLIGSIVSFASGTYLLIMDILPIHLTLGHAAPRFDMARWLDILSILLLISGFILLYMYFRARRFVKDTKCISNKLSSLQLGALNTPLTLSRRSLLAETAEDINKLESGIENAVEQRDRSNKMRVELITNVSHDLKTPLTSIINYADLLCEEPLEETAAGYADALRAKAYRLKNMVQDVFELSKATTGNLPIEKQPLDLVKLIRQTLADMDERILKSTLTFKTSIATEPLMIEADGNKLYRVFQNLFVNCIQYSLENSRVHVQLSAEGEKAVARIKNISKNELDFDTCEIVERFVRADASRTTEGSGLGLSIVQSFTEACGGTFSVQTDADMFIATVSFPLLPDTPPVPDAEPSPDKSGIPDLPEASKAPCEEPIE